VFGGTFDPIHIGHLAVAEDVAETLGLERVLFVPAARPPHKPGVAFASAEDRLTMVELAIAGNTRFAASRIELDRPGPSYMADTLAELRATAGAGNGPRLGAEATDHAGAASRLGADAAISIDARAAAVDGARALVHTADAGAPAVDGARALVHAADVTATTEPGAAAGRVDAVDDGLYLILSAEAFEGLPTWHDPRRVLTLARLVVVPREGYADASAASLGAWFPDLPDAASRAIFLDGPRLHVSATDLRECARDGRSLRYLVPDAVRAHIEDHGLYRARRRDP